MSRHHLQPEDQTDFALATDLGRKAGRDAADAIMRTMLLGQTAYQREVIVLSAAVSVIAAAGATLRAGSTPDATDRDLIEALVEMIGEARSEQPQ